MRKQVFRVYIKRLQKNARHFSAALVPHSRLFYGKSVETREPYSRYYMSKVIIKFIECHNYNHLTFQLQPLINNKMI